MRRTFAAVPPLILSALLSAALAPILFGDANPSGKLPVSLPRRIEDTPAFANYPGVNLEVNYAEGIYVGYR